MKLQNMYPCNIKKQINYNFISGALVFIISLLFYIKTLAPTVVWGDCASLSIIAYLWPKAVLNPASRPLFVFLSNIFIKIIPFGDVAYRVNLSSAFFGALTVLFLFQIVLKLTKSKISAFVSSMALSVSHTFWLLSVVAAHQTLTTLFLVLIILMFLKWQEDKNNLYLYLTSLFFTLSTSNNFLLIILIPAFIYIIGQGTKQNIRARDIYFILLSFCLGLVGFLLFYWPVLVNAKAKELGNFFIYEYAVKYFSVRDITTEVIKYPFYLLYQFPIFAFLIGLIGAKKLFREKRKFFIFLFLMFIINIITSAGFFRQRHYYLFVISYVIFSIWVGFGSQHLIKKFSQEFAKRILFISIILISIVLTPLMLYYNIPKIAKLMNVDLIGARDIPYRDNDKFFLLPDKSGYYGAYDYASQAFFTAKPDSLIIADYTPHIVMRYLQIVERKRLDIEVRDVMPIPELLTLVKERINQQPIYLADDKVYYGIDSLKNIYKIVKQGNIYEVQNIK
ncbi:MAG: DUF2723 domain-containing protein [Candidatus Omnitrophota bacterium]|nr:DUF2723 domain-containing protein [Candidatus Omnitrophota bacterium]